MEFANFKDYILKHLELKSQSQKNLPLDFYILRSSCPVRDYDQENIKVISGNEDVNVIINAIKHKLIDINDLITEIITIQCENEEDPTVLFENYYKNFIEQLIDLCFNEPLFKYYLIKLEILS